MDKNRLQKAQTSLTLPSNSSRTYLEPNTNLTRTQPDPTKTLANGPKPHPGQGQDGTEDNAEILKAASEIGYAISRAEGKLKWKSEARGRTIYRNRRRAVEWRFGAPRRQKERRGHKASTAKDAKNANRTRRQFAKLLHDESLTFLIRGC